MNETSTVVKNQGTKQRVQRILGDCWQWKGNGQCSKGDKCSFRHGVNERAKTTQPSPSPRFSTQQSVRNASRTRSPRGKSPSGRMFRLPSKAHFKGICTNSFCLKMASSQNACSTSPKMDAGLVKSALLHSARLMNSPAKGLARMVTKCSGCVEKCTTIGMRISRYGAAEEVHNDFADELKHTESNPMCSIH